MYFQTATFIDIQRHAIYQNLNLVRNRFLDLSVCELLFIFYITMDQYKPVLSTLFQLFDRNTAIIYILNKC